MDEANSVDRAQRRQAMDHAQKLKNDLARVRTTSRHAEVCDAIEALLEQGHLMCRWDAFESRPIRVWRISGELRCAPVLPVVSDEIPALMLDLLLASEAVFSTEIKLDACQLFWMLP